MANYTLVGDLGAGKSIIACGKARDFLLQGRKVAGNMDLFLHKLLPLSSKATYLRLSDFPTSEEMWGLGMATDSRDEQKFGALYLDELAVFLNSREWKSVDRDKVIKCLRHIRKMHWHTFFISQDIESIDAQARRALIEHKVTCKRADRLSIPVVGWFLRFIGFSGRLPQVHFAIVQYGKDIFSPRVDKWFYYGSGLYDAYNTDQIFTDEPREIDLIPYPEIKSPTVTYPATIEGSYTVLSNHYVYWRFLSPVQKIRPYLGYLISVLTLLSVLALLFSHDVQVRPSAKPSASSNKHFSSFVHDGSSYVFITSDGIYRSTDSRMDEGVLHLKSADVWYSAKPSKSQ